MATTFKTIYLLFLKTTNINNIILIIFLLIKFESYNVKLIQQSIANRIWKIIALCQENSYTFKLLLNIVFRTLKKIYNYTFFLFINTVENQNILSFQPNLHISSKLETKKKTRE